MQHFGKGALRVAKNYTKGYSDTQAKVRDATSNDPWGPSGTQMNELAQMTYNQGDFVEIMEMLDKRLNDKGKNWRHVFKSLTVLDYLLHAGSENVVIYFKDNIYIIKTLKEFQYVDEESKDQGANVRQKAKDITNLLQDESRLREERRTRATMRDRMIRSKNGDDPDGEYDPPAGLPPTESSFNKRGRGKDRDEEELRKAIEASKKSLAAEQSRNAQTNEDKDLEQAIKLSEEEERRRHKALEDSNANSLFDDQQQIPAPQSNNPFPLLDPTPYSVGLQPQYTVQPQFTSVQPQFTSFNPYHNQAEQENAQAEFFRQQQQWQQQQQQEMMRQQQEAEAYQQQMLMQQQQQQQQQQEQEMYQQQMQQQWYMQQQQQQQQQPAPLQAQPTGFGTKNPFAPAMSNSPAPPLPSSSAPQFNLQGTYANSTPSQQFDSPSSRLSPAPMSNTPSMNDASGSAFRPNSAMQRKNEQNAALNNLFANKDDGMDTFGNIGALRYGHTDAGRAVAYQTTGNNPFGMQQQQQQQQQQVNNDRPFF